MAYKWIRQFLLGRRQSVKVNGTRSGWSTVTSGIPQGSVLGPVLFVIYINDLPESIMSCVRMFADDTKIWSQVGQSDNHTRLQEDLDRLVSWSLVWQLRFNADKCKVLHVGPNNPEHQYSMESGDTRSVLLSTEVEKDLGVNMDPSLKFSKHTEIQMNKANRILGLIRRSYELLDGESLKRLYMALVRPHLDYCNSVCFPRLIKDKKLLEGVQRRETKLIPDLSNLPYEERLKK